MSSWSKLALAQSLGEKYAPLLAQSCSLYRDKKRTRLYPPLVSASCFCAGCLEPWVRPGFSSLLHALA